MTDIEVIDRDLGRTGAGAGSGGLQGAGRPRHPRRGRHHLLGRRHPAVPQLLRLVSAARPLRVPRVPDRRPRRGLRPGPERAAPARPQGQDLGAGAAYPPGPADGRPAQQGPARRAGPAPAGGPGPGPAGAVVKSPDREVQGRIALVFATFLEKRSLAKVVRTFLARAWHCPRRDRFGDVVWRRRPVLRRRDPQEPGLRRGVRLRQDPDLPPPPPGARPAIRGRPRVGMADPHRDVYPPYIDWEAFERIRR